MCLAKTPSERKNDAAAMMQGRARLVKSALEGLSEEPQIDFSLIQVAALLLLCHRVCPNL
jgi:hypothetical protein